VLVAVLAIVLNGGAVVVWECGPVTTFDRMASARS
jgi:hypothetical protein